MANSKIGQYQLEFELAGFTQPVRSHRHAIWVSPLATPAAGAPPTAIDLQLRGGGSDTLQAVANEYGSYLRTLYATSVSISSFTLWQYATENARDFVAAGSGSFTTSGGGSIELAQQLTLTYRSAGGGILKQVFLECNVSGNQQVNLTPTAADRVSVFAAYMLSARSPAQALDNTFPVAPLKSSAGQNEVVWRKIFRQ